MTVPRLKLGDKGPCKDGSSQSDSPTSAKSSSASSSQPKLPASRTRTPGRLASSTDTSRPGSSHASIVSKSAAAGQRMASNAISSATKQDSQGSEGSARPTAARPVGRVSSQEACKTPATKAHGSGSASRNADSVASPDYVPGRGDGASPALLQAADGPLACQTAIGRRRDGHGNGQGVHRFGDWYTGTEADLERDLAELAAQKEASRAASRRGSTSHACAPFSDQLPGQGMGKEVGAMLRDLAEKADRELQELQANLDEGREKDPARQQPLQQRLIDSWQGKSYYDRLKELAAEAGGPSLQTGHRAAAAGITGPMGGSNQGPWTSAHRPAAAPRQTTAKDKENKPCPTAPANTSAAVAPSSVSDGPKPSAVARRKVGFATDKPDAIGKVSVREATPAAKKSKTVASKADVEEGPGPPEIHGAAKAAQRVEQPTLRVTSKSQAAQAHVSDDGSDAWQAELEAEVSSMQATIRGLREKLISAERGQAAEKARADQSEVLHANLKAQVSVQAEQLTALRQEAAEHVEVADAVEPAVASPTAQEVALGSRLNKKLRVTEPRSITAVTHKVCNKCKQNLPAEAFCRQSNTSDGLNLWCKRCRSDRIKQWKKETWQKNAAARKEPDPEKQCAQCLENLPASAFFRDYSHRTGLEHFCKCCKKAIKTERLRVQREAALLGLPVPRKRKTQAEQVFPEPIPLPPPEESPLEPACKLTSKKPTPRKAPAMPRRTYRKRKQATIVQPGAEAGPGTDMAPGLYPAAFFGADDWERLSRALGAGSIQPGSTHMDLQQPTDGPPADTAHPRLSIPFRGPLRGLSHDPCPGMGHLKPAQTPEEMLGIASLTTQPGDMQEILGYGQPDSKISVNASSAVPAHNTAGNAAGSTENAPTVSNAGRKIRINPFTGQPYTYLQS
ncbi:hypothetical protein WJX84_007626 [Apatococcus fuscideae]|uniref:Uncharacterized protein n=1 Tax=Apatococcus fuscideae TaxID=2026836 RepID=A0AAW1T9Y4_9CHLO